MTGRNADYLVNNGLLAFSGKSTGLLDGNQERFKIENKHPPQGGWD
jgi:hypothetical protein